MSGDVQPRKRRDKRRKREDDESSHGVHLTKMGTDDVHLHVHHEHETGGHWCAKILFFALLALLLGLVSLIIMENRGLSDLDTPLSESRFSNYFDGWVDEKRESHDESAHGSIEDHNDHDDDHDNEPYEEDEEPLSEVDEEDVTGENDEEEEDDEDENNDADEDDNKYEDERNTQEAADDNDEDNSKELGEDDNDENDDETATQEDDDNNTVEQEDDDNTRQNSADPFDEDDDDDDDDASAQVTKEQSQNSADPFDEDDDDDDDDDTFEIFEQVVENDAEELLLLQQKAAEMAAKNPTETSAEAEEDNQAADEEPSLLGKKIKPKTTTDSGGGGQDFDDDADDSFEAQLNRAKAELERENFAAAYVAYSKLSKDYADQPQAFFGKCKSLYELNKRDESKIHANAVFYSCKRYLAFDELIKNNEEYRTIAEITLNVIEELGVLLQARDIYDGLRLRFPEDAELLKKYALNEIKRQAYTAAEKLLQIVLKSNPKDGFALAHMGLILKLCDDNYKAALPLLRKGIESKENGTQNAFLYIQLGETYQRLSMNEEAQKVYEKAAQLKLIPSALQRPIHYEPKLRAQPFWSVEETANKFHFQNLQENWKSIRQEGMKALNMQRLFKNESENLREYGTWKMFEIFTRGNRHDQNCKVTPKTCALIDTFPAARKCRQGQVKFSILQPKTHIWSHCGPTNTRLRAHLGLTVPKGAHIRVAKENRTWSEGEFLIFDDSFEHEVWHEGEHNRLVLIIDIWHPDLTEEQRQNLPTI